MFTNKATPIYRGKRAAMQQVDQQLEALEKHKNSLESTVKGREAERKYFFHLIISYHF